MDSFKDFFNKVFIKAEIFEANTNGNDVGVWAKQAQKFVPNCSLNGYFHGYINNLTAENFDLKAGKSTFINGNANIKGLPNVKNLFI